ncbi:MAG TPA: arginine deiminase-related protein [Candidatus Binataceae bacterium]|nr:arginine deiminase-related protein [Candidatus Binataceae bacterium]
MARTIIMGDPRYFSVRGGANPHTRNVLGMKKKVDPELARRQWHSMARTLLDHGAEVFVIGPRADLPGLVYPANAGFLYPLEDGAAADKTFHLANLLPTRAPEREVYRPFIESLGFKTSPVLHRFEGEADFFPAGRYMLFTYGKIERQRFVPTLQIPPWRRVYGLRSEADAIDELRPIAGEREILALELVLEAYYHGDTVLCSFGPRREFLLAYLDGLSVPARGRVREALGADLVELSQADAAIYAANSFQIQHAGRLYLFMPEGISEELRRAVRERGVEPVTVDVSEFLAKGGGSIKCMLLDLGPAGEQPVSADAAALRVQRSYKRLFAG